MCGDASCYLGGAAPADDCTGLEALEACAAYWPPAEVKGVELADGCREPAPAPMDFVRRCHRGGSLLACACACKCSQA